MSNDADITGSARSWRYAVLLGLAAGAAAALVWLLVVMGTDSMQSYLLIGMGIVVAAGVHLGARRPGRTSAIIAVVITALTVAFATYFVERYLIVKWFHDAGATKHIPLVPYLDWMSSVLRHAFSKSPALVVYTALSLGAAGWFGYHGFEYRDSHGRRG